MQESLSTVPSPAFPATLKPFIEGALYRRCFTDYAKTFDCVDHNKLWKTLKEMGIPDRLLASCMQLKKQQLEPDMEQRLVPNRKRSTSRLYIVTLLI